MDSVENEIRAFEDFQRHQRHEQQEYEIGRARLREKAIAALNRQKPAYRHTTNVVTGEKSIEPIFTVADHQFMKQARVFA